MKKGIELNAGGGTTLFLTQTSADGDTMLSKYDGDNSTFECAIKAGDMVALLNFYRYIKRNDIRNKYLNPNGRNADEDMHAGKEAKEGSSGSQVLKAAQEAISSLRETISSAYLKLEEMEERLTAASQDAAQKEKELREAEVANTILQKRIDVLEKEHPTVSG